MQQVTIHSHNDQWANAQVLGVGKDTFTGEDDVFIVRHPDFENPLDFYAEPDAQGRHLHVGNSAFWITIQGHCPNCSTVAGPADLFCGQCGTNLNESNMTSLLES
jgi:hypothetical protein